MLTFDWTSKLFYLVNEKMTELKGFRLVTFIIDFCIFIRIQQSQHQSDFRLGSIW